MSDLLIVEPMAMIVASSRGTGAANLTTKDPKEVWADDAVGSSVTITADLGSPRLIDTIFFGSITGASPDATWTIIGGDGVGGEPLIQPVTQLRVPDAAGTFAATTHALWTGPAVNLRHVHLRVTQPAGSPPLRAGTMLVGRAYRPALGREWGAGRRPIDTGTSTALPSGGFAVVEGTRKRALTWTFGDLTTEEVDQLEGIALRLGDTSPALVVEDDTRSAGLWSRIHYGLFRWKAFERRNRAQSRWEMELEEWA